MATLKRLKPLSMTVISQALKDSLLEQGTAVEDAQVIYQGVPLEGFHFKPLPRKSQETCRILYAGQLSNAKGVHTLLKAASILVRDPSINFEISIVGSGVPEYETELRGIVQTGGLTGRVRFLGKRPHSELARIYNEHHVFVFPSEWKEPFGLTHLEAMASGCAVVSTTRGGTRELVRDGDNALAFEAGDAEDLVKKLMKLIRNENRRMAMIGRARTWLEKHHSMDFYVENLEEFLSSSLRN
jgi:glycosyltransferase involved in cell wall biosynthesis